MTQREWRISELVNQLLTLGVKPGGVLVVHSSFRSVRPVEGGPAGMIAALRTAIGPEGTLVMPSWSGLDDEPFEPATTSATSDLGILADTFWRLEGVVRSDHPFAFAAAGPLAARITSDPLPLPPHCPPSPIGRIHELDGQVILLGVGHDSNTTLHLAELMSKVPYGVPRHCTIVENGSRVRIAYLENDHCCQNFSLADVWLRRNGLQKEGQIGNAHARLVRSRDIVKIAMKQLAHDPLVFLHPAEVACEECDAARQSIGYVRS
ncbi:AAC(3)-VI family aminoglycoside N-acetyltransferase [Sinorhizobium medicae]|nr:AAC(3)-VI family aminoglycoside N-acetyltransferase [Sinorhizobium medicae]